MSEPRPDPPAEARLALPVAAAAELQDHLLIAGHDLERLRALLEHACEALLAGFHGVRANIAPPAGDDPTARAAALRRLDESVVALQFQDLAAQLIAHTGQRLRHCADRLGRDALADQTDETEAAVVTPAPARLNPVAQAEMHAGSIELF